MARRSDVILLVRIKEHTSPQNPYGPNTTYAQSVESCEVLKTFKGELAEGSTVTIHLFDGDYALPDRFRRRSCHVVFRSDKLQRAGGPDRENAGGDRYFTIKAIRQGRFQAGWMGFKSAGDRQVRQAP